MERSCRVCVTGGNGYIGSWLVMKLLNKGYTVHATLRDLSIHNFCLVFCIYFFNFSNFYFLFISFNCFWNDSDFFFFFQILVLTWKNDDGIAENESKVGLLRGLPNAETRLVLFEADVYNPSEFESAIQGCEFVFHVATPMMHQNGSQVKLFSFS